MDLSLKTTGESLSIPAQPTSATNNTTEALLPIITSEAKKTLKADIQAFLKARLRESGQDTKHLTERGAKEKEPFAAFDNTLQAWLFDTVEGLSVFQAVVNSVERTEQLKAFQSPLTMQQKLSLAGYSFE